ncbi:MAG: hypothetical protein NVSMB2_09440 [Chloroflexota bacterium]
MRLFQNTKKHIREVESTVLLLTSCALVIEQCTAGEHVVVLPKNVAWPVPRVNGKRGEPGAQAKEGQTRGRETRAAECGPMSKRVGARVRRPRPCSAT